MNLFLKERPIVKKLKQRAEKQGTVSQKRSNNTGTKNVGNISFVKRPY